MPKPQAWSLSDEECVRVLRCLQEHREKHGSNPSFREMQDGLGLSSSSVVEYRIDALLSRGWVVAEPGKARSIRPTMAGLQAAQLTDERCPHCGGRLNRCAHEGKSHEAATGSEVNDA